jgi:membrane protease YdiL (CAAX protease family)
VAVVLFQSVQWLNGHFSWKVLHYLAHKPLNQYVDRTRTVAFLLAVFYGAKSLRLWVRWQLNVGFCYYVRYFIVACWAWVVLFGVVMSHIQPVYQWPDPHYNFFGIFVGSLLLACIEEMIFRGFVWDVLRMRYRPVIAVLWMAFLFAIMHFSMCTDGDSTSVWLRGLQCAKNSLLNIQSGFKPVYFLCLFLLGCILVHLRLRSQTLWASIGFHQGLVFVLLLARTKYYFYPGPPRWWGNGSLTNAWFVITVLLVFYLGMVIKDRCVSRRSLY